jgi:hypothetical protein
MQFSKIFFLAAAVVATAAPTGGLEARGGGIECAKHNGKWQYGWEDTEPSEQYICQTSGLLVCTRMLSASLDLVLTQDLTEHPQLRQRPQWQHSQPQPPQHPWTLSGELQVCAAMYDHDFAKTRRRGGLAGLSDTFSLLLSFLDYPPMR